MYMEGEAMKESLAMPTKPKMAYLKALKVN